jgi:hypothetical protein
MDDLHGWPLSTTYRQGCNRASISATGLRGLRQGCLEDRKNNGGFLGGIGGGGRLVARARRHQLLACTPAPWWGSGSATCLESGRAESRLPLASLGDLRDGFEAAATVPGIPLIQERLSLLAAGGAMEALAQGLLDAKGAADTTPCKGVHLRSGSFHFPVPLR